MKEIKHDKLQVFDRCFKYRGHEIVTCFDSVSPVRIEFGCFFPYADDYNETFDTLTECMLYIDDLILEGDL